MMQELVRWWEAVHYTVLRQRCAEAGMHNLAAKQASSLLRYIGAVPADKAFYEAGEQQALSATLTQATRRQCCCCAGCLSSGLVMQCLSRTIKLLHKSWSTQQQPKKGNTMLSPATWSDQ